jgi:hypothetical protein
MASPKKPPETDRRVVITTEWRGVFFGRLVEDKTPERIVLAEARNCLYWSSDVRGVVGLATTGPTKSCRVGPAAPEITLWKVTGMIDCTPEAVKAWEGAPWS